MPITSATSVALDSRWTDRVERCRELRDRFASAQAILKFYELVLPFQRQVAKRMATAPAADKGFREQVAALTKWQDFQDLLRITADAGPERLARRARQLEQTDEDQFRSMVNDFVSMEAVSGDGQDAFFPRACLQPIAERLQMEVTLEAGESTSRCPVCRSLPQLAVLRPEGEGAARSLWCSFCLREWLFRRIVCPWCGEQDKEKLPRFSSQECHHVYISACDTCKRYLKLIDMTTEGRAVPLVDEVAAAVLDLWANEQGYSKIVRNLMGF
ncbi:MAG: formate dehydrogenase accessory protein FdhE [Terriglobales bacterium]